MKRNYFVLALVFVGILSGASAVISKNAQPKPLPKYVDFVLAGINIRSTPPGTEKYFRDKKSGYYLRIETYDGQRIIALQNLHPAVGLPRQKAEIDKKMVSTDLPFLGTGKGVKIGDSKSQVRKKLGRESSTSSDSIYYECLGGRINGWNYLASYSFTKGKLSYILYRFAKAKGWAG